MLNYESKISNKADSPEVQTALKIGKPGDKFEREADAVADRVMRMSESDSLRMQPVEEEEELLQPKIQMQPEEEEELQMMVQHQPVEEEEFVQPKLRMQPIEKEEELLQPKSDKASQAGNGFISSNLIKSKNSGTHLPEPTNQIMSRALTRISVR